MLIPVLLFILGLVILIKSGDWFVNGATGIAYRFNVPDLLVGATVVSIGTTLPEVMVSATSALSGHGEIAYGNAIGSIICNTALISAITLVVKPSKINSKSLIMPVIFFFVSAAIYVANTYITGYFSRTIGLVLLAIFAAYMVTLVVQALQSKEEHTEEHEINPLYKDLILLVAGAALIAVGSRLLVNNGTIIAEHLGVPESVIALTFVALGTSLPELVTAITSLIKGHSALSLGNIIGANIFNLVLVSGVSIVLAPFEVPQSSVLFGHNATLVLDIPVMLAVMGLLTFPAIIRSRLTRLQGIILLVIYSAFCLIQFTM